jgi:hypothetical protein
VRGGTDFGRREKVGGLLLEAAVRPAITYTLNQRTERKIEREEQTNTIEILFERENAAKKREVLRNPKIAIKSSELGFLSNRGSSKQSFFKAAKRDERAPTNRAAPPPTKLLRELRRVGDPLRNGGATRATRDGTFELEEDREMIGKGPPGTRRVGEREICIVEKNVDRRVDNGMVRHHRRYEEPIQPR